jgi:hypothetical protein
MSIGIVALIRGLSEDFGKREAEPFLKTAYSTGEEGLVTVRCTYERNTVQPVPQ